MNEKNKVLKKKIFGWSNTNSSYSITVLPKTTKTVSSIIKALKNNNNTILGRGAGQSYGDQSLNNDQIIIETNRLNKIIEWNKKTGVLKVQSGVTLDQILNHCLKDNWTLATIPGTRYVTVGGALSNNVHGKNSYRKGNFGEWVKEFKIIIASGESLHCSKEINNDLFFAVIGGAGLFGIVTEITLQLIPIPSPYLSVKKSTASSLNELMNDLDKETEKNDFAIAQVDCFPKTSELGRGTIHAGNFTQNNSKTKDIESMRKISQNIFGIFPKKLIPLIGKYFLNDYTMKLVSGFKYHLDKKTSSEKYHLQDIYQFTFLLDNVPNWKQVFRHGFFEYEPLIPKEKAREIIPLLIALTHQYQMPAYLSAIKVHRKDNFLLSYSMDGYSFAMDIPRCPKEKEKQDELFQKMNKIVIDAGGIVYLAKDANLTANEFRKMYKNVDQFLALKKKYDPEEIFQSDMYRRIFKNNKEEMTNKIKDRENNENKLLNLDQALDLDQEYANKLYKKNVNAGLLGIYEILGLDDLDAISAEGMEIKLKDGRKILDFTSALGIVALGHNHPRILKAEERCRIDKILNAIKLGPSKLQSALAHNLSMLLPDPLSVSFFTVSGAEAVEAAMKLCEKAQGTVRNKFITTKNAYHGKTHTTLSVSRSGNFRDGFIHSIPDENMIEIPYNNIDALKKVLKENGDKIVAIIIEPIQGQGIEIPKEGYLKYVVDICHKNNVLVIFDEVKVGMSRSGTFCAFQSEDVVPDVVTISKALGGGSRAIGAMVTSEKLFKKAYGKRETCGLHTTTFGGLGVSCAVAIEALNIFGDLDFQKSVREKGEYLKEKLDNLKAKYPNQIKNIKGRGLLQGIQFNFRNIFNGKFEIPALPLIDTFDKVMMASLVRTLYKKYNILAHFTDSNIDIL
ncbi:MAG: FAD dependent oxidoreductase, partial [Parcubacteria group bacterium GW2011_GWB1_35_5]